jgi:hypothetical protein
LGTFGFNYIQKSSLSLPLSLLLSGFEHTRLDDVSGVRGSGDGGWSHRRHQRRARSRARPPTCPQRCRLGSSMIPLRRPPPSSQSPPPPLPFLHPMSQRSHHCRHCRWRAIAFSSPPRSHPPPPSCACRCCHWMPFF